jgi:hypothetical protein
MTETTLGENSVVVQSTGQVSSDLAGEAVILNLDSGTYYGLDAVGARIWSLIQEPKTLAEVRDAILAEYDVEIERCERDIRTLLEKLASEGLIEIRGETLA